jgi:integrase
VETLGLSLVLMERRGTASIHYDLSLDSTRERGSTGTQTWEEARVWARAFLKDLALRRHNGPQFTGAPVTLGQVLDAYRVRRLSLLNAGRAKELRAGIDSFEAIWGRDQVVTRLSQSHVDRYVHERRYGGFAVRRDDGTEAIRDGVSESTIHNNWRALMAVLNWATREQVTIPGAPADSEPVWLLASNPLTRLKPPPRPRSSTLRTPVATPQRYEATLAHCDQVTPSGALRIMLMVARFLGWRRGSIRKILWQDVLLTEEELRAALADFPGAEFVGATDEWAEAWPWGAIWARDTKQGFDRLVPLPRALANALHAYRRGMTELGHATIGAVPLFPSPSAPERPVTKHCADGWLRRAERTARKAGARVPKLTRGLWHPYRRLARSERGSGRFDLKYISYVCLWTLEGGPVMDGAYFKLEPDEILRCAAFADPTSTPPRRGSSVADAEVVAVAATLLARGQPLPAALQERLVAIAAAPRAASN